VQLIPKLPLPGGAVRRRLMAASCALLSAAAARGQQVSGTLPQSGLLEGWSVDSALAYYHEDGRIQAIEPVVNVSKTFADGNALDLNVTFDSLSGSSPNGALTSRTVQTFASPSGKANHRYTVSPGQLPSDPDYHDDRVAVGANFSVPVTRLWQVSVGGKVSAEDDFISGTVDASVSHDFNEKNSTLSLGVYNEFDSLRPIGGAPVAGSDYALAEKGAGKTKDGVGLLLGFTQVMTRNWLSEFNISLDRFHGYLNDPYKITSIIDGAGNTIGYQYENRPDQRTRKSAYWENRVAWGQTATGLSLRYMSDDWHIHSETAQLHVRWTMPGGNRYVEPSVRWYHQTAANFYTPWLVSTGKADTGYESSDSRLGAFHALTYGVKYAVKPTGIGVLAGSEFNVRLEYYQQIQNNPATSLSSLQGLDLYPGLKAVLVQVGWRF
jgi:hypothetical protein